MFLKYFSFCTALLFPITVVSTPLPRDVVLLPTPVTRQLTMNLRVAQGVSTRLPAQDLERRLGLRKGELEAVTFTAVPSKGQGTLLCGDIPVPNYATLTRAELDQLLFLPDAQTVSADFSFIPQCSEAIYAAVSIGVNGRANTPPMVQSGRLETLAGMSAVGVVDAIDAEGDALSFEISTPPHKGTVRFSGTGYCYTPYAGMTGSDRFSFFAQDSHGSLSESALVDVSIEQNSLGFAFADMAQSPSEYAATKLCGAGVLSGEAVGSAHLFYPQRQVPAGEFVVMLLGAMGKGPTPCVNTGLSNDSTIPLWLKPYLKTAMEEGIVVGRSFEPTAILTRSQAVILTARAAKLPEVKAYNLQLSDLASISAEALPSYRKLGAYRMLDLYDGSAKPNLLLTRAYAADLIWPITSGGLATEAGAPAGL